MSILSKIKKIFNFLKNEKEKIENSGSETFYLIECSLFNKKYFYKFIELTKFYLKMSIFKALNVLFKYEDPAI